MGLHNVKSATAGAGARSALLLFVASLCHCSPGPDGAPENSELQLPPRMESGAAPIRPIDAEVDLPPAKVLLGNRLYHDTRLSGGQNISCATCHPPDGTGTVGSAPQSTGETAYYDIPTIFNTGDQFAYFWNGRAQSLETVVEVSLQAENIMNASWATILPRLSSDGEYVQLFESAYPGAGVSEEGAVDALTAYVRSLTTPNAAFDRWLNGENLSESARAGYELFVDYGCIRCHQGTGVGGNLFASFRGFIESRETVRTTDNGRFNITNLEADRYLFKVPSLRNVAVTAPYFHDGSVPDLDDAVDAMARYQLDRKLTRGEISQIVSFLESLTGWREGELLGGAP